ncbi:MAG: DUF2799 domain-containing protein, partial [Bdellovibrionales bacterium]|nr:DUF2799 domain-containing protein [Bdellovibrionales bacterium]
MFRNDVKSGYMQGKTEYCTPANYEKWGKQDGLSGQTDFPNKYSVEMKICLADDQLAKKAKATYQKSFDDTYCGEDRVAGRGKEQAMKFDTLDTSKIKKLCRKNSTKLISLMRASYKKQMKTNCTSTYWMMKGEKAAEKRYSKSRYLGNIQKCPSSRQSNLTSVFSKSYNERKALLIEEEKLALERKKHRDMVNLEREKLRLEKDKINTIASRP